MINLIPATAGEVYYGDSPDVTKLRSGDMLPYRRRIQMIFQDPFSSLNPRMTVGSIIAEAIAIHKLAEKGEPREKRVRQLLDLVGLPTEAAKRFPHEFSGGQRQRIGIARGLAVEPEIIIADEPVSALDVSIQAQVINLLEELQATMGLAFVFISHDLSVVSHLCHRVSVMYLGQIVEEGTRDEIFNAPRHPYTKALLSAVPTIEKDQRRQRILLPGDPPSPVDPPSGCRFHPRCPARFGPCNTVEPRLLPLSNGSNVACHLFDRQFEAQIPAESQKLKAVALAEGYAERVATEFSTQSSPATSVPVEAAAAT
jgi:oligopeptide/dipeptide ABC transporter ATP-binding protein